MASTCDAPPVASPDRCMLQLIECLRNTIQRVKKDDVLTIPARIIKTVTRSSEAIDTTHLPELVSLFDDEHMGDCCRLEPASFYCMLHLLLRSKPCIARDRGFYLFLVSMRRLTRMSQGEASPGFKEAAYWRKVTLGQQALGSFVGTFLKPHQMLARSWSGQFILELVRQCPANLSLLLKAPVSLSLFGRVILHDTDYDLRLISGMMIQQLLLAHPDPAVFWPPHTNPEFVSWLTPQATMDLDWMNRFNELLLRIDREKIVKSAQANSHITSQTTRIMTVESLDTPGYYFHSQKTPIGMVTSCEYVSICVTSNDRLQVFDIPFNFIQGARLLGAGSPSLQIELVEGTHYITNGLIVKGQSLDITFAEYKQAMEISRVLNRKPTKSIREEKPQAPLRNSPMATDPQNQGTAQTDKTSKLYRHAMSAAINLVGSDEAIDDSPVRAPKRTLTEKEEPPAKRVKRMASSAAIEISLADGSSLQSENSSQDPTESSQLDQNNSADHAENKAGRRAESGYGSLSPDVTSENKPTHHAKKVNLEVLHTTESEEKKGESCNDEVQSRCGSAGRGEDNLLNAEGQQPEPQPQPASSQISSHNNLHDGPKEYSENSTDLTGPKRANGTVEIIDPPRLEIKEVGEVDGADSMKPTPISKPLGVAGDLKEPTGTTSAVSGSRLKRPHHKTSGSIDKKKSVDWDQDLRVDDDKTQLTSTKRQKRTPLNLGPSKSFKEKKQAASTGAKKNAARMLSLSPKGPEADSAPPRRVTKRNKRQVTKTLTSARQRRAAADRANQKLVLATEQENLPYDFDDPIESSAPQAANLELPDAGTADNDAEVADSNVQVAEMAEAPLPQLAESKPGSKDDSPQDITVDIGIHFPELKIPNLQSNGECTTQHGEIQVPSTWPEKALDQKEAPCESPVMSRKRKSLEDDASPTLQGASGEDGPATSKRLKLGTIKSGIKRTWGNHLTETLETAGILPTDRAQNENGSVERDRAVPESSSVKFQAQLNNKAKASQISRNVSWFIARQNAKEQKAELATEVGVDLQTNEAKTDSTLKKTSESGEAIPSSLTPSKESFKGAVDNDQSHMPVAEKTAPETNPTSPQKHQTLQDAGPKESKDAQQANSCVLEGKEAARSQVLPLDVDIEGMENSKDVSAKQPILNPETDSSDDTSENKRESSRGAAEVEHDDSPLHDIQTDTDNGGDRLNEANNSDISVCTLSRTQFIARCRRKAPLNSQTQTVDENGSPRPKQFSRHSRIARRRLQRPKPDQNKNQAQPSGLANVAYVKDVPPSELQDTTLVSGSERDTPVSATSNASSDYSILSQQNRKAGVSSFQRGATVSALSNTTFPIPKKGTGSTKGSNEHPTFIEKLRGLQKTQLPNKVQKAHISKRHSLWDGEKQLIPRSESNDSEEISGSDPETEDENDSSEVVSSSLLVSSSAAYAGADTSEWQKALRATQKTTLDILLDTSNRLVRHLMSEENAILDVVDVYKKGCNRIINQLEAAHDENLKDLLTQLEPIQVGLIDLCQGISRQLDEDKEAFGGLPSIRNLSAACEKKQKRLLRQIENAVKEYARES
ncbi:hypothetical protein PRK78_006869 [Emydomyces testavorans]|uniref:PH-like domain-containing protein n=1 Tax=Emydomyces testavorans TaxID=2070801 RepID=A0AAF0IPH8_9EURO|nr:hypothetical protein PRK78_006869 [Emydomyces testavorans]